MNKGYKNIILEQTENIVTIWLNNVAKKNAFDNSMVTELRDAIQYISKLPSEIIVITRGKGDVFCSGADLLWMKNSRKSH